MPAPDLPGWINPCGEDVLEILDCLCPIITVCFKIVRPKNLDIATCCPEKIGEQAEARHSV